MVLGAKSIPVFMALVLLASFALLLFHSHGLASAAPPSTQYLWRLLEDVVTMVELLPGAQTNSFILEHSLKLS